MTNLLKRLDTLEGDLTPKQVVLKVLEHLGTFSDVQQRLQEITSIQYSKWQQQTVQNLKESVERRFKDQIFQTKAYKIRKSRQEFFYLYELGLLPWRDLDYKYYRYLYQFSGLIHGYLSINRLKNASNNSLTLLDDDMKGTMLLIKEVGERLWTEMLADHLSEVKISQHFFDGKPLFMPEQKDFLDEQINSLESLMGCYLDFVNALQREIKQNSRRKGISEALGFLESVILDPEAIQDKAVELADKQFEQAKMIAKKSVYESEDRYDDADIVSQELFESQVEFQESLG